MSVDVFGSKALISLEMKYQGTVYHVMWVLETEILPTAEAVYTPQHQAIFIFVIIHYYIFVIICYYCV